MHFRVLSTSHPSYRLLVGRFRPIPPGPAVKFLKAWPALRRWTASDIEYVKTQVAARLAFVGASTRHNAK